jgi:hypothetical protein
MVLMFRDDYLKKQPFPWGDISRNCGRNEQLWTICSNMDEKHFAVTSF